MKELALLRALWPILRLRVVALIAARLKTFAARGHVTLTDDEAIQIATLIVGLVEELIDRDDDPLVAKAAAVLEAK